jgi:hypothetical protein
MTEASKQTSRRNPWIRRAGIVVILALCGVFLLTPRTIERTISDQRTLSFKAPFFVFTIGDSRCVMSCNDQHGQRGEVRLLYTFLESPVIFLSSPTNENIIFCLYDFDIHDVLIRIDTTKPYSSPGPMGNMGFIVLKSPWEVQEGSLDDWRQTLELIKEMPLAKFNQQSLPARDFGVFKQHFDKESTLEQIRRQITLREDAKTGLSPRRLN